MNPNANSLVLCGSVVNAVPPLDLGGNAATGPWAGLRDTECLEIFGMLAAGAAGNGPILAVEQATDNAGTGAKALSMTELWTRVGDAADLILPDANASFVPWNDHRAAINRTTPAATYDTDAVGGDDQALEFLIRIHEGTLDKGFTHVRINTPAAGGVRLGFIQYIAGSRQYAGKVTPTIMR